MKDFVGSLDGPSFTKRCKAKKYHDDEANQARFAAGEREIPSKCDISHSTMMATAKNIRMWRELLVEWEQQYWVVSILSVLL